MLGRRNVMERKGRPQDQVIKKEQIAKIASFVIFRFKEKYQPNQASQIVISELLTPCCF